ncbi:phosphate butyryltransferase [Halobacillus sp. A1]|uniref:phosphate butyryltransferase n=1 Tax=Halobacillus sp. A1 TaxID=2880262 RepID=UPI0020A68AA7|nr:phosphate butyryltransferase [Halobacillus sp. A1]MCP3032955.1 phosphate butyryltransferase [Halobacillus sp. A1]
MKALKELIHHLEQQPPKRVVIAQAADYEVLRAVKQALDLGIASFLLTGNQTKIRGMAVESGIDIESSEVEMLDCPEGEAANEAVKAVSEGKAHVVMKGHIDTKALLKAVLNKEYGLRTGRVLSHVALFEVPNQDRMIFLTDSAMNISPTLEEKSQIVNNAVNVAVHSGWVRPKVAMVAAVEVVNPSMQATIDAAALTQMNRRGQIKDCVVDGPLAFDNAVSKEAAVQKGIESEVAGAADILVVPTIEVANALYKSFMYFADARVAGIISGAKAPIVLTSRSDSAESKVYSLALALRSSTN